MFRLRQVTQIHLISVGCSLQFDMAHVQIGNRRNCNFNFQISIRNISNCHFLDPALVRYAGTSVNILAGKVVFGTGTVKPKNRTVPVPGIVFNFSELSSGISYKTGQNRCFSKEFIRVVIFIL